MRETATFFTPELVKRATSTLILVNGLLTLAFVHYAVYLLWLVYTAIAG